MGDEGNKTLVNYPTSLNLEYMICNVLPHQATIIKKSLSQQVGLYNENYKIISDWVFFMEALFDQSATYGMIDSPVVLFDKSGISSQYAYTRKIITEQLDYIAQRYPAYVGYYKMNSPYVKKYFRGIPRWKRFWKDSLVFPPPWSLPGITQTNCFPKSFRYAIATSTHLHCPPLS